MYLCQHYNLNVFYHKSYNVNAFNEVSKNISLHQKENKLIKKIDKLDIINEMRKSTTVLSEFSRFQVDMCNLDILLIPKTRNNLVQ